MVITSDVEPKLTRWMGAKFQLLELGEAIPTCRPTKLDNMAGPGVPEFSVPEDKVCDEHWFVYISVVFEDFPVSAY